MSSSQVASEGAQKNEKLAGVTDAVIEETGRFKYILIKVHDKDVDGVFKHVVRGSVRAQFHADIYDMYADKIEKGGGLECEVVGGGRIEWPAEKAINIFGYSQGYGKADHAIAQEIVKKRYPQCSVTWSNDGY
ncbi:hypothetical protein ACOMHN_040699 [Nucella lapillus]